MSASTLFEDFGIEKPEPVAPVPAAAPIAIVDDTSARLQFDEGYKEGWADAQAAAQSEQSRVNADIATALQEAGFAYFEARQHILSSMKPLLEAMVCRVLPELAQDTIAPRIVELISKVAAETEPPIKIICAPDVEAALGELIANSITFPVELMVEETLTSTQAMLRYDEGQTIVDLDEVVEALKTAVADFYELNTDDEERIHA